MAYIFIISFISKLVSVEMACLLGIQNEIQAVWLSTLPSHMSKTILDLGPVQFVLDKSASFTTRIYVSFSVHKRNLNCA